MKYVTSVGGREYIVDIIDDHHVSVDGVTGTLIQTSSDYAPEFALLWVRDGIIYSLSGQGDDAQPTIDMANSLQ